MITTLDMAPGHVDITSMSPLMLAMLGMSGEVTRPESEDS